MSYAPRLPDWPHRLAAFVESRRAAPFSWGGNDCGAFAADAVAALTGSDPLAALRGAWADEEGAAAVIAKHGGLHRVAARCLGKPLRHKGMARRGAVVLASMQGVATLGVLLGSHWCAPGAGGLEFRPAAEVRLAWGV